MTLPPPPATPPSGSPPSGSPPFESIYTTIDAVDRSGGEPGLGTAP